MTNTWFNKDKLYLKFGTARKASTTNEGGEYRLDGPLHMAEFNIDLTTLAATDGSTILADDFVFPKNARIDTVEVMTHTAATGTGAVLNLGLISQTDRSTEVDFNGFVAALPLASIDTAGKKVTLNVGSSYAGALIGTTNATAGMVCADYDTAAFTAGVVRVRISYYAV